MCIGACFGSCFVTGDHDDISRRVKEVLLSKSGVDVGVAAESRLRGRKGKDKKDKGKHKAPKPRDDGDEDQAVGPPCDGLQKINKRQPQPINHHHPSPSPSPDGDSELDPDSDSDSDDEFDLGLHHITSVSDVQIYYMDDERISVKVHHHSISSIENITCLNPPTSKAAMQLVDWRSAPPGGCFDEPQTDHCRSTCDRR